MLLEAKEYQRLPGNHQKLGKRSRIDVPSQPSKGANPSDAQILASRIVQEYISVF